MKIGVKVMPREVLLDSQGRAIEQMLKISPPKSGQPALLNNLHCRVGKFIELKFDTKDQALACQQAKEIADKYLINPLLESYEIQVLGEV